MVKFEKFTIFLVLSLTAGTGLILSSCRAPQAQITSNFERQVLAMESNLDSFKCTKDSFSSFKNNVTPFIYDTPSEEPIKVQNSRVVRILESFRHTLEDACSKEINDQCSIAHNEGWLSKYYKQEILSMLGINTFKSAHDESYYVWLNKAQFNKGVDCFIDKAPNRPLHPAR